MINDTWRVVASSGTYSITERTCAHALITFSETHPDDWVTSVSMVDPTDGELDETYAEG